MSEYCNLLLLNVLFNTGLAMVGNKLIFKFQSTIKSTIHLGKILLTLFCVEWKAFLKRSNIRYKICFFFKLIKYFINV
jgi:hypothetical protein